MQFQTAEAQRLAGLKPVDGVFKLETALRQIDEHLNTTTTSSPSYAELASLKQSYSIYLDEARQLRQKGMASFRKYLAMKNTTTNAPSPPTQTQPQQPQPHSQHNMNHNISPSSQPQHHHPTRINEGQNQLQNNGPLITPPRPIEVQQATQTTAAMLQREEEYIHLKQENETLRQQMERLQARKAEHEETEHELRLILEEYKFTQLSHKQEMNSLQNTISSYKKASDSKGQSLDTLSNELESTKNEKQLLTKQNIALKQQMTQYLTENTSLKEQLIERAAQCDALKKEMHELKEKLALSQQLNNPIHIDNIDAPVVPKPTQTEAASTSEIEQRLHRVCNMMQQNGDKKEMTRELEMVMEALHPITMNHNNQHKKNVSSNVNVSVNEAANDGDNYVITAEEYADIEKVIDDRDAYLNKAIVYEKNMKSLAEKYEDLQRRMKEVNEEKSLMMRTLKESVQKLADENNQIRDKMSNLKDERSSIKEHDLKTQNDFYKLYEENRERKFEMEGMKQQIKALNHDIETYKYLSQQLKDNNSKLSTDLSNSLERIERLVQEKEIIAKKLRESNKLTQEVLKERNQIYGAKKNNEESKENQEEIDWRSKYDELVKDKAHLSAQCDENEGTVNELTNQIIALENRLRSIELENELLKKEIQQITEDNNRKTNQIKSAQRVALSIMQSNKDGMNSKSNRAYAMMKANQNTDMFGLQPPPQPDLITSLLTYLLPFLFEEDDQPKIV
eukprot:122836_1